MCQRSAMILSSRDERQPDLQEELKWRQQDVDNYRLCYQTAQLRQVRHAVDHMKMQTSMSGSVQSSPDNNSLPHPTVLSA